MILELVEDPCAHIEVNIDVDAFDEPSRLHCSDCGKSWALEEIEGSA